MTRVARQTLRGRFGLGVGGGQGALRALAASVCLWLAAAPSALACGMVSETVEFDNADASFEAQTALIHRHATSVDVHLRMTVERGSPELAWVIPVTPGARLRLGDPAVFTALEAITAPEIQITYAGSGGGCSAADTGALDEEVEVKETGTIGEYVYTIISPVASQNGAQAAVAWLNSNGYVVPSGAEVALQPYADAGLDFLGVRLARVRSDLTTEINPLVITNDESSQALPAYPLALSRVSMGDRLPVVLYVIASARARVNGAVEFTISEVVDRIADHTFATYDEAVLSLTGAADDLVFITEAVLVDWTATAPNALARIAEEGSVLTRLYAQIPKDGLRDVLLEYHPVGNEPVSQQQKRTLGDTGEAGCQAGAAPGASAVLALALIGLLRRRRRQVGTRPAV